MTSLAAKPTENTFNFTVNNTPILGASQSAAVYGFQHCGYDQVSTALSQNVQKVYDCSLGNEAPSYDEQLMLDPSKFQRLDGTKIPQVDSGRQEASIQPGHSTQESNRLCKASIVNIVLENYRRSQNGEAIIPVIVCIDKANNNIPLTSENLLSKTKKIQVTPTHILEMNRIVTHSELRRMYKLCNDPQVDKEIRDVARASFKFVKVTEKRDIQSVEKVDKIETTTNVKYDLELTQAPWAAADFMTHWKARKQLSVTPPPVKAHDWRAQANQVAADQKAARPAPAKSRCFKATIATVGLTALAGLVALGAFYVNRMQGQ